MFASNVKSVIGAKVITNVISSMKSPATLPNKPIIVSIDKIHQITNITFLLELEKNYDDFLDKNMQALMLYNIMETYLEIRDAITLRISKLRRERNLHFHNNKYYLEA